jgi:hypothetical protein
VYELGTAVVGTGFMGPVHVEALKRIGVEDKAFEQSLGTRKASLRTSRRFLRQFIVEEG